MTIKILSQEFKLEYVDSKDRGGCTPSQSLITIGKKQSPQSQEVSLLHEIFHTVLDMGGYYALAKNEELVSHLTNSFFSIRKDNPGLFIL